MPESYYGHLKHSSDGWYTVLTEPEQKREPLPEYLKVFVTNTKDNRDYFQVLEGVFLGKKFSISRKNGISFIEKDNIHKSAANLTFDISSKTIEVVGLGIFGAITESSNPVPVGTHDVEIPDAPHGLGDSYLDEAKYSRSWFRIGNRGDRYLHCGNVSAGCITVTSISEWDKIYKHLILSRKNNKSVGFVKVKK